MKLFLVALSLAIVLGVLTFVPAWIMQKIDMNKKE
jgi:hypothetical protein